MGEKSIIEKGKRNVEKLQRLWNDEFAPKMEPHWKRYKKKPTLHNFQNLLTEGCRAEAYVMGHLVGFALAVNAIAWVAAGVAVAVFLL